MPCEELALAAARSAPANFLRARLSAESPPRLDIQLDASEQSRLEAARADAIAAQREPPRQPPTRVDINGLATSVHSAPPPW